MECKVSVQIDCFSDKTYMSMPAHKGTHSMGTGAQIAMGRLRSNGTLAHKQGVCPLIPAALVTPSRILPMNPPIDGGGPPFKLAIV